MCCFVVDLGKDRKREKETVCVHVCVGLDDIEHADLFVFVHVWL